jgi:hypothetical protein
MKQRRYDGGTNGIDNMIAGRNSNVCLLLLAATQRKR